jgi:hypothetical protein
MFCEIATPTTIDTSIIFPLNKIEKRTLAVIGLYYKYSQYSRLLHNSLRNMAHVILKWSLLKRHETLNICVQICINFYGCYISFSAHLI